MCLIYHQLLAQEPYPVKVTLHVCVCVCVCVLKERKRGLGVTSVRCLRLEAICSSEWSIMSPVT